MASEVYQRLIALVSSYAVSKTTRSRCQTLYRLGICLIVRFAVCTRIHVHGIARCVSRMSVQFGVLWQSSFA